MTKTQMMKTHANNLTMHKINSYNKIYLDLISSHKENNQMDRELFWLGMVILWMKEENIGEKARNGRISRMLSFILGKLLEIVKIFQDLYLYIGLIYFKLEEFKIIQYS